MTTPGLDSEQGLSDYLNQLSPTSLIKNINIGGFKQNAIQMVEGKLLKNEETKEGEVPGAVLECASPLLIQDAIRLPNISLKTAAEHILKNQTDAKPPNEGFASPTNILQHITFPQTQIYDNLQLQSSQNEEDFTQFEGELFRKAPEGKLKRYWYCLLGKELYCKAKDDLLMLFLYLGYKKKDDERHKDMHSLVGIFIKSEKEETLEGSTTTIYPFKIIFPINKVRVFYCRNRDDRSKWVQHLKTAVGYSSIEDFYDILGDLGKGKFGQVKLAVHKKSQRNVAIKIIKKKNMTLKELEL